MCEPERRPALDRLMNDARKRRFDCVLVWRFDRFARTTKHLLLAWKSSEHSEFSSSAIRKTSIRQSPLGQTLFTIVSAVAQLERDLIRERVKAGLRVAKAKGVALGRPRVAVDARAVVKLRSQGHSWAEVCRILNLSRGTAQRAVRIVSALD